MFHNGIVILWTACWRASEKERSEQVDTLIKHCMLVHWSYTKLTRIPVERTIKNQSSVLEARKDVCISVRRTYPLKDKQCCFSSVADFVSQSEKLYLKAKVENQQIHWIMLAYRYVKRLLEGIPFYISVSLCLHVWRSNWCYVLNIRYSVTP